MTSTTVPNHHADHRGFSGPFGWLAALTMGNHRDDVVRWALKVTAAQPGEQLVDIGCGNGRAARLAAEHGLTVIGVDPSDPMLSVARMTTKSSAITYNSGAAEAVPLDTDVADVAWSIAAVHHWRDLDGGLGEARRVVRSGGRFLAIELHVKPGSRAHGDHGWNPQQADVFAAACRAAGFLNSTIVTTHADGRDWLGVLAT
jgi:ubiquinone/menaquinone biosynthesis C-methylase UbiE